MELISLRDTNHDFYKSNLVTQRGKSGTFDVFKCSHCGLEGKRYGLTDMLSVRKAKICTKKPVAPQSGKLGQVRITRVQSAGFGLDNLSVHDRVPCPKEYIDRYADDVWVMSPTRNEPVRLFSSEYEKV